MIMMLVFCREVFFPRYRGTFGLEFQYRSLRRSSRAPTTHTPCRCPSSSSEKVCRWSLPNLLAIAKHGVVRPRWRTFLRHPEWNQLFGRAGLLCLQQGVVPDEIRFGEIDEESETRLNGIPFRRKIGTV